jgi:hypothetical protein
MKNQYFGDINDYKKYGLLRALSCAGAIKITFCWMLTESDDGSDGGKTGYLGSPRLWRHHDPALFDSLSSSIQRNRRNVMQAERMNIISSAKFYTGLLHDDATSRTEYFGNLHPFAAGSDLIFFDPDNGLEVKSVRKGKRGSSKYLYWDELEASWQKEFSLLVYQHFPRVKRETYIARMKKEILDRLGIADVCFFQTSHVLFILIPRKTHAGRFRRSMTEIEKKWNSGKESLLKIHL